MRQIIYFLPELIKQSGCEEQFYERLIFSKWNESGGETLAVRSYPVRFCEGILTIALPSQVWKNQLLGIADRIREKINDGFNRDVIHSIEFVVDKNLDAEIPVKASPVAGSEQAISDLLTQEAAKITDQELRDLFIRTASKNLAVRNYP